MWHIAHRASPVADSQNHIVDSVASEGPHIQYRTSSPRDCQPRSVGSARVCPPTRPWSGWVRAGKRLTRATKINVWDEVSVPQVWAGVKGKARDGYGDRSGGGGLIEEAW